MLAELNELLEADARGEDTQAAFEQFMQDYGDFFPENPRTLDELVEQLARRAAAASRLLASLSAEQRAELAGLMQSVLGDLGLEYELDRLGQALRWRRPDLAWGQGARIDGGEPLGLGDATTALEELADLESLEASLAQDYPGASLDDVDLDAVERALGRQAVDDVEALRRLERELAEQVFLTRDRGELQQPDAGVAGEPTGTSRQWRFGDEQPLDVVATVRNAVLRQGPLRAREQRDRRAV